jgi:hypothetical protein
VNTLSFDASWGLKKDIVGAAKLTGNWLSIDRLRHV